ncbi:MAG: hypothetical protein M0Q38_05830 [Bacteroidales bacterium]|jgi:hypothetical protein|nr:hypothetical protein [Bacteroidales bacterium]
MAKITFLFLQNLVNKDKTSMLNVINVTTYFPPVFSLRGFYAESCTNEIRIIGKVDLLQVKGPFSDKDWMSLNQRRRKGARGCGSPPCPPLRHH